jgi:hypothetical protein
MGCGGSKPEPIASNPGEPRPVVPPTTVDPIVEERRPSIVETQKPKEKETESLQLSDIAANPEPQPEDPASLAAQASICASSGSFAEARGLFKQSISKFEAEAYPDLPSLERALNGYIDVCRKLDDRVEGELPALKKLLHLKELQNDQSAALVVTIEVAEALRAVGQRGESEAVTVNLLSKAHSESPELKIRALRNLAHLQQEYLQAVAHTAFSSDAYGALIDTNIQLLQLLDAAHGSTSSESISVATELVDQLHDAGRLEESCVYSGRVADFVLNGRSPLTEDNSVHVLTHVQTLKRLGRNETAAHYYDVVSISSIPLRRKGSGEFAFDASKHYKNSKKMDRARAALSLAVRAFEDEMGSRDLRTLDAKYLLADAMMQLGDYDPAVPLANDVFNAYVELFSVDSTEVRDAAFLLGFLLLKKKRLLEAVDLRQTSLDAVLEYWRKMAFLDDSKDDLVRECRKSDAVAPKCLNHHDCSLISIDGNKKYTCEKCNFYRAGEIEGLLYHCDNCNFNVCLNCAKNGSANVVEDKKEGDPPNDSIESASSDVASMNVAESPVADRKKSLPRNKSDITGTKAYQEIYASAHSGSPTVIEASGAGRPHSKSRAGERGCKQCSACAGFTAKKQGSKFCSSCGHPKGSHFPIDDSAGRDSTGAGMSSAVSESPSAEGERGPNHSFDVNDGHRLSLDEPSSAAPVPPSSAESQHVEGPAAVEEEKAAALKHEEKPPSGEIAGAPPSVRRKDSDDEVSSDEDSEDSGFVATDGHAMKALIQQEALRDQSAYPPARLLKGYFRKQGHLIQNWKRRFFVLEQGVLSYYEKEIAGI